MANYTNFIESLPLPVQSILGGVMFGTMIFVFSVVLLSDMHHTIRRVERVLKEDDKYIN
jgi:hypothetical protein